MIITWNLKSETTEYCEARANYKYVSNTVIKQMIGINLTVGEKRTR